MGMLVFIRHSLAYLATPKTGTTALEAALRPHCSVEVRNPPGLRHMSARRYQRQWAPFLREAHQFHGETMAVLREPVSWLESWYRYRGREQIAGTPRSTAEISFDKFIEGVLAEKPPAYADVGDQNFFATSGEGDVLIDHLFVYEQFDLPLAFLSNRLGRDLKIPKANISPKRKIQLAPDLEAELRSKRAAEFALYDQVASAGHLRANGG